MTQEGFRDPPAVSDDSARARVELEGLFAAPQAAVKVIVKRRRASAAPAAEPGDGALQADADQRIGSGVAAERGPKVHRLTASPARPAANARAAQATPARDDHALSAGSTSARRARRTSASRDPVRRPSPVRIVMQAQPKPAAPQDEPAWRRILCVELEEVSYRQVLLALNELQTVLDQARDASDFVVETPAD